MRRSQPVTPVIVRASVQGRADAAFPGWLVMIILDAAGRVHRIEEKEPVLTEHGLDAGTRFPVDLWLRGEHVRMDGSAVVVRLAHGVVTSDGRSELTVASTDVRWLQHRGSALG